jgi:hypothetical protein
MTALWWKLTGRFIKKDVYKLQIDAFNKTLGKLEKSSDDKWEAITDTKVSIGEINGILKGMVSNQKKRRTD